MPNPMDSTVRAPQAQLSYKKWLKKLPAHIAAITCKNLGLPKGKGEGFLGPNCFTAVLYWFRPEIDLTRSYGEEDLLPVLKTAGYVLVKDNEPRTGDVLLFARTDLDPRMASHTAMVVGPGLVWNKWGPSKWYTSPEGKTKFREPHWTFSDLDAVQDEYAGVAKREIYRLGTR